MELPGRRRRAQRAGVTEGGGREGVRRSLQGAARRRRFGKNSVSFKKN